MTRKRVCVSAAAIIALVAGGFYYYLCYDPINKTNFARIRFDMTPKQVEELLGRKPDRCSFGSATWVARNGDEITVELLGRGISNTYYHEHRKWYESVADWLGLVQHVRE